MHPTRLCFKKPTVCILLSAVENCLAHLLCLTSLKSLELRLIKICEDAYACRYILVCSCASVKVELVECCRVPIHKIDLHVTFLLHCVYGISREMEFNGGAYRDPASLMCALNFVLYHW